MELLRVFLAMVPVVMAGVLQAIAIRFNPLPQLASPLDFGVRLRGEPLLGANKTIRGVLVMVLGSTLFTWAFRGLLTTERLPQGWPSLADPGSALFVGMLMGLGYSLGELPNSFIKRRLRIAPGARPNDGSQILFYLADQLDSVIGVVLVMEIVFALPLNTLLSLFVVGALVHIAFDRLLYAFGVKRGNDATLLPAPFPLGRVAQISSEQLSPPPGPLPAKRGGGEKSPESWAGEASPALRTSTYPAPPWGAGPGVRGTNATLVCTRRPLERERIQSRDDGMEQSSSPPPHTPIESETRPLLVRVLIYLVERFSLLSALPAFAVQYAFIAHYVSAASSFQGWSKLLSGFMTFVGIFLILRLSDDLKDKQHDDRYYADRPVQRGLVTTRELRVMLLISVIMLAIANVMTSTAIGFVLFLATLAYLVLMRYEFFIPDILRPRLLLYLATHQLFVPILIAYVIYHNGGTISGPQDALFVVLNLLMIMAVEVARKIRPTVLDQTGRDTYSAYLGHGRAVLFLLAILGAAQWLFYSTVRIPAWMFLLLLLPALVSAYYFRTDSRYSAKLVLNSTVLLLTVNMLVAL